MNIISVLCVWAPPTHWVLGCSSLARFQFLACCSMSEERNSNNLLLAWIFMTVTCHTIKFFVVYFTHTIFYLKQYRMCRKHVCSQWRKYNRMCVVDGNVVIKLHSAKWVHCQYFLLWVMIIYCILKYRHVLCTMLNVHQQISGHRHQGIRSWLQPRFHKENDPQIGMECHLWSSRECKLFSCGPWIVLKTQMGFN